MIPRLTYPESLAGYQELPSGMHEVTEVKEILPEDASDWVHLCTRFHPVPDRMDVPGKWEDIRCDTRTTSTGGNVALVDEFNDSRLVIRSVPVKNASE